MLTDRDMELLTMLIWKTGLASLDQAIAHWWGSSESAVRNGRRRIRLLSDLGWVDASPVLARPLLELAAPLYEWAPTDAVPEFDRHAWQTLSRWKLPARRVTVLAASRKARLTFGGTGRRPLRKVCQFTHDLHVTAVYLKVLQVRPQDAAAWRGEGEIPGKRSGQILPDAILVDAAGAPYRAIEFGGRYSADRLRHFHEGCVRRNLPYEVW